MIKLTLEVHGESLADLNNQLINFVKGDTVETLEVPETAKANLEGETVQAVKKSRKKKEAQDEARIIESVTEDESVDETKEVEDVIQMEELLDLAKAKVQEVSRDAVKEIISKYASRISEVDLKDYPKLKADLEALNQGNQEDESL